MNQPNLVDIVLVVSIIGTVFGACMRGLGRESLHTLLYGVALGVGFYFIKDNPLPQTQQEVAKFAVSCGFYILAMYVFMWAAMKLVGPLVLAGREMIGMRSRFWAGALSIVKVLGMILALNLWFAIHSPDAHPLRLNSLPALVRESILVQLSDKLTEDIYKDLAARGVVEYTKTTEIPLGPDGKPLEDHGLKPDELQMGPDGQPLPEQVDTPNLTEQMLGLEPVPTVTTLP